MTKLDRIAPRAPFRAWLYRIATNVCITMLEAYGMLVLAIEGGATSKRTRHVDRNLTEEEACLWLRH